MTKKKSKNKSTADGWIYRKLDHIDLYQVSDLGMEDVFPIKVKLIGYDQRDDGIWASYEVIGY